MRRWALLSLGVALACAACTLLTDLDGLSGPPVEAGAPSAGDATAPEDATADSPFFVDASDGGPGVDASGSFCATAGTHALCADFDTSADILAGFSKYRGLTNPGSSYGFDELVFKSPPRGAMMRVAEGSPDCVYSQLERTFVGTFQRAVVSFDLWPGAADGGAFYDFAKIASIFATKCAAVVGAVGNSPTVYRQDDKTGNTGTVHMLSRRAVRGMWSRITIEFASSAAPPPFLRIAIDGQDALLVATGPVGCAESGSFSVALGPHCLPVRPDPVELRLDNVVVDVQ